MSQVHGKQIKDESVLLGKINPQTGQTLTLVGTSKIQQPQAPVVGDDLANKTYVDSVAAGLDPKESVNLATTTNIVGTYNHGPGGDGVGAFLSGTGTLVIDGVTISVADRILLKNQTATEENGIYDVGTAGTNWFLIRTLDFDGTPTNEVNGGEFTFVMSGDTLADTGWVVSEPSGVDAVVGTTSIQWVQFSSAGVINAGSGLEQSGNTINFQTGDNSLTVGATNAVVNVDNSTIVTGASGIEVADNGITATQINSSVAGAGLTGGNGSALAVNVNNGLSINADVVELGGSLTKDTVINGISTYDYSLNNIVDYTLTTTYATFYGQNSAYVMSDVNTTIESNGALKLYSGGKVSMEFSDSSLVDASGNGYGLQYYYDYSGTFVTNSLITKKYVDDAIALVPTGDITGITAGAGLTGGGSSGYITLDVNVANGLSINSDVVELGGELNKQTQIWGGNQNFSIGYGPTNSTADVLSRLYLKANQILRLSVEDGVGNKLTRVNTDASGDGFVVEVENETMNYRNILFKQQNSTTFEKNQIDLRGDGDAQTINGTAHYMIIRDDFGSKGLVYNSDYSANFTEESLITKRYVDDAIALVPTGDITGITAGAGLSGGGTTGFLQMDIELTNNGGLTFSIAGDGGTLEADYSSLSSALAGNGLVQNGTALDVNVGDGLAIISDVVEASLVVNSGLTFSTGAIDLSLGTGLTINGGDIITDASLSLLTGDLVNSGVATGSSIQSALEAIDTQIGNIEISQNISQDLSPTAAANFTSGINVVSATTVTNDSDGEAWVYLNGVQQVVGGATSSAWYWSADGGTTARANKTPLTGDQLIVNIDTLGYSISGSNNDDDIIEIKYDALS